MNSEIKIRILKNADKGIFQDIVSLYKDAGWWEKEYDSDPSFVKVIVKKSFCFAGAFDGKRLVGMGRALSDGISDAYIEDIVVLKKYRDRGIGSGITNTIIEQLKKNNIDWITLIGEPGTEKFYRRLNFRTMKNYLPMRLKI
ncbi:MAG: GNAT family N-acetyltransferase [Lentisphaerae bacterium GWF2_44_16]|nr:MAG: GNAT family N-acetyltransferase [Lentisphaerae bacterium GWF2_44_16]